MSLKPDEIYQFIDLTTLNATDSTKDIMNLVDFALEQGQRGFFVAAICVHSNFAPILVSSLRGSPIKSAVVAAAFPHGQSPLSSKIAEINYAVENSVDEIDIVINRGLFLSGDQEKSEYELHHLRAASKGVCLKTILETGELKNPASIGRAAELAIKCGADFIKTSTGKSEIGATPEAVTAMCKVVKTHFEQTCKHVGIKVSGGVRTIDQAQIYVDIVKNELGEAWLKPELFRIGASSLAKDLVSQFK